jgi:hypothetical protein
MNRAAYFIAAMKAEMFRNRAWVFTAFSIIQEAPDAWKKDPYAYRLVQTPTGVFFVDPNKNLELAPLEDAVPNTPPFTVKERLLIRAGNSDNQPQVLADIPNLKGKDIETTYGNLLANWMCLAYPFGGKVPYLEGRFSPGMLEALILPRLKDSDDPIGKEGWQGEGRNEKYLYVDEYLKFTDAMFYLAGFASLWVPAGTKKSLLAPPGVIELRNKLIEENRERLSDPAVVAKISKQLQEYDMEFLKGDDSLNYMISKKSFEVVRAKKFLMHGAETGLSEGIDVDLIQNSLSEGWDVNKFPAMNNSLRAGSFNRGAQTMLGGESVKWLLRASMNINITEDDCGSTLGNKVFLTEKDLKRYQGFTIVTEAGLVKLTEETIPQYLHKEVIVRSSMYCKLPETDLCKTCVGERLAANPTAASSAVSEYGSAFLALYMKAAHGKALTLAKLNYKTALQ